MTKKNSFGSIGIRQPSQRKGINSDIDVDTLSINKQETIRFKQDTKHRNWLVIWMMIVVSVWLIVVLLITMFNIPWRLYISEKTLITLLATTTINILGLSKIILHGLFKPDRNNKR